MTLDSALKMMLIKSANDIAVAIGEAVGGTQEFDPSNLVAQWGRSGLLDRARAHGLV